MYVIIQSNRLVVQGYFHDHLKGIVNADLSISLLCSASLNPWRHSRSSIFLTGTTRYWRAWNEGRSLKSSRGAWCSGEESFYPPWTTASHKGVIPIVNTHNSNNLSEKPRSTISGPIRKVYRWYHEQKRLFTNLRAVNSRPCWHLCSSSHIHSGPPSPCSIPCWNRNGPWSYSLNSIPPVP